MRSWSTVYPEYLFFMIYHEISHLTDILVYVILLVVILLVSICELHICSKAVSHIPDINKSVAHERSWQRCFAQIHFIDEANPDCAWLQIKQPRLVNFKLWKSWQKIGFYLTMRTSGCMVMACTPGYLIRQCGVPLAQCEQKTAQIFMAPAPFFVSTKSAL